MSLASLVQVEHAAPAVQRQQLAQMLDGALQELQAAGCHLAGGHTCTGAEASLGLTITGHAHPERLLLKSKLQPGQKLLLTKPLGTGVVLRGSMLMRTKAAWLQAALRSMLQSNAGAVPALQGARGCACSDVTGFGLLGHALEMAQASGVLASWMAGVFACCCSAVLQMLCLLIWHLQSRAPRL